MKFKCIRAKMLEGLKTVGSAVGKGDALGDYRNVRISPAGPHAVTVTATDGFIQVETSVPADVTDEAAVCIPGDMFRGIIDLLPEGPVHVDAATSSPRAVVAAGPVAYRVGIDGPEKYHEMHRPGVDAHCVALPSMTFREMLRKSVYAASQDKMRQSLLGVNVEVGRGEIVLVATDGRRLAWCSHGVDGTDGAEFSCVLPAQTAKVVQKLCSADGDVRIETDGKTAFLRGETWSVTTKLMDVTYPYWRKVIPDETALPCRVEVDADLLKAAVRQCAFAASERTGVRITVGSDEILFEARSEDASARTAVPVKYAGETVRAAFDPRLVLDALAASDDDTVHMLCGPGCKALVFRFSVPYEAVVQQMRMED